MLFGAGAFILRDVTQSQSNSSSPSDTVSNISPRVVRGFARTSTLCGNNSDRGFTILSAVCHDSRLNDNKRIANLDIQNCIANYGGDLACATKWVNSFHSGERSPMSLFVVPRRGLVGSRSVDNKLGAGNT